MAAAHGLTPAEINNQSVNGSTLFDGSTILGSRVLPLGPELIFDAFGMNDGQTAQFNSGQTFPGAIAALRERVALAQSNGLDVILSTSPHPHTERNSFELPSGIPLIFPSFVAPPVPADRLVPPLEDSVVQVSHNGVLVPASSRHLMINEAIRQVAKETGVLLVDAEKYWFDALTQRSQTDLYGLLSLCTRTCSGIS